MATWRWLEGRRRERHRTKFPAILVPLQRMLARRPWLAGLASVRALWSLLYVEYADVVAWAPPTPALVGESSSELRSALLYFTNVTEGTGLALAYGAARSDIDRRARHVPGLGATSRAALDTAVAELAAAVRLARATRRAVVAGCR